MITRASIVVDGFLKSSNYINIRGEHPSRMSIVGWDKIVTKKEELKDSNWMYTGKEDSYVVNIQLYLLKIHNDGAIIIKE